MKRLFSLAAALGTVLFATAQLTEITIEEVIVHDGTIDGIPAGYTTYHIYANLTNELDFVSAVFGDSEYPLFLECSGDILQVDGGGDLNTAIFPLFFPQFPALEYDSFLTIGGTNGDENPDVQSTLAGTAAMTAFNEGDGFLIADPIGSSWFNLFPCSEFPGELLPGCADGNLSFAGPDSKVLIAQITATGEVSGMFNVQVFVDGVQENTLFTGLTFSTDDNAVFGCTNEDATNYDPTLGATIDDLSCIFPCTLAFLPETAVSSAPICFGGNTGTILVEATGAQGADYFYVDTIAGQFSNFGNFGSLLSGTYDLIVVDAVGCGDTIQVSVPQAVPVEVTAELTSQVSCHDASDGVIEVTSTTGGNGVYTYVLSSQGEFTSETIFAGLGGTSANGQSYTITAFDGNGCSGQTASIQINNPTQMNVYENGIVDASCANIADGAIYLTSSGGVYNGVGTQYSVDGENFGSSPLTVTGGLFTVTAIDQNGCIATTEEPVFVGPAPIEVNATSNPETCFGLENGEVSWAPVNGSGMYTYTLDDELIAGTSVGMLAPGEYTVTVTDSDTCAASQTVVVEAALPISVSTSVVDASCFGDNDGAVTVTASGGSGSFMYSEDGTNFISNNEFGGFEAGSYTLFVQDQFGCEESGTATVDEPEQIVINGIVSEGSTDGQGTIDVTVTGGSLPYEYEWIGPGVSGQSTQDLNELSTGAYTIEVIDANGCSSIQTFNITTSDIQELANGVLATVYPNPSQGVFVVDVLGGFRGELDYLVVDAQGRTVQGGQWVATDSFFRTVLDLSNSEAGMYRLVMLANGRPSSLQLVKMN